MPRADFQNVGINIKNEFGLAGLWNSLFYGSWQIPKPGLSIIILGGWADDILNDSQHHIQRINTTDWFPSIDTRTIKITRKWPFEVTNGIPLNFIGCLDAYGNLIISGDIIINATESRDFTPFIDYHALLDNTIHSMQRGGSGCRYDKFDIIVAIWLADGRIFGKYVISPNNYRIRQVIS